MEGRGEVKKRSALSANKQSLWCCPPSSIPWVIGTEQISLAKGLEAKKSGDKEYPCLVPPQVGNTSDVQRIL